MKTKEEVLDRNGFDFEAFKYENEYSAKNLLKAMDEYAINILKEITTYNPNKNTYDSAIDILTFLEKEL